MTGLARCEPGRKQSRIGVRVGRNDFMTFGRFYVSRFK